MENKIDRQQEFVEQIKELFEGEREYSHMTGDLALCGVTVSVALRQITEEEKNGGKKDENRA